MLFYGTQEVVVWETTSTGRLVCARLGRCVILGILGSGKAKSRPFDVLSDQERIGKQSSLFTWKTQTTQTGVGNIINRS